MTPIQGTLDYCQHYGIGFIRFMFRRFQKNESQKTAAYLTYTTLFAIVPLMTVTYGILSALPSVQNAGEQFQDLLFSNFVPESGQVLQDYLKEFARQARSLTVVGGVFLVVTSVLMMSAIEKSFNQIWSVSNSRKGASSFLLYWAILTLGPILIGVGLAASSYVLSHKYFLSATDTLGLTPYILQFLPFLTSSLAFTMLYLFVPNCRVSWKHALAGGVFTAICFELAKLVFSQFIAHSPSYEVVYGAFAAVPLFLFWIFISWNLVLLGATLVMALDRYQPDWVSIRRHEFSVAIHLLRCLFIHWKKGRVAPVHQVRKILAPLSFSQQNALLGHLKKKGLIVMSDQQEWHLARDLSGLTLWQLFRLFPWAMPVCSADKSEGTAEVQALWPEADAIFRRYDEHGNKAFNQPANTLFSADEAEVYLPESEK
ncbi:YihY family inner membrane protein [Oceanospirillum sediminis]|uniref:UPF0761 membrane protein H4O21_12600 n=1 Tax=Oceanospirillum sediminis TaxID=2760088 RepID=A0A839ISN6_9GAMM|nr:YihY family inner membrane protein [Oceanospirillum sediminis]MBB1487447.1 YihY family inner membrane protein [Oceanospirillum sediminis]